MPAQARAADDLARDRPAGELETFATFDGPMPTGVTVPHTGRIFVCHPMWGDKVDFMVAEVKQGNPVASICHGPWTLIEAGVVKGRRMTSWPSLKTDLQNAGATWENREAVTDNNLVTSQMPADIPAFNRQMIDLFARARSVAAGL